MTLGSPKSVSIVEPSFESCEKNIKGVFARLQQKNCRSTQRRRLELWTIKTSTKSCCRL